MTVMDNALHTMLTSGSTNALVSTENIQNYVISEMVMISPPRAMMNNMVSHIDPNLAS